MVEKYKLNSKQTKKRAQRNKKAQRDMFNTKIPAILLMISSPIISQYIMVKTKLKEWLHGLLTAVATM